MSPLLHVAQVFTLCEHFLIPTSQNALLSLHVTWTLSIKDGHSFFLKTLFFLDLVWAVLTWLSSSSTATACLPSIIRLIMLPKVVLSPLLHLHALNEQSQSLSILQLLPNLRNYQNILSPSPHHLLCPLFFSLSDSRHIYACWLVSQENKKPERIDS